jgi:hypothetical protein
MRHLSLLLLVACGGTRAPSSSPPTAGALTLGELGVGPIDAHTPGTIEALQSLFPRLELKLNGDRFNGELSGGRLAGGVSCDAMLGGDVLFYVVPYDGNAIEYVQATSAKVRVAGHPWAVGGKVDHRTIDEGECWGEKVTCFKTGEHVAIAVAHDRKGMQLARRTVALDVIDGATIERVPWSPKPFAKAAREAFPEELEE